MQARRVVLLHDDPASLAPERRITRIWIYKSSTSQLTHFNNRQMYLHNVLLCVRITESMTNADEAKLLVVKRVLEQAFPTGSAKMPGLAKAVAEQTQAPTA